MKKLKRHKAEKVFPIRLIAMVSKEQYRKVAELANKAECSMAAIVRLLISDAK